MADAEHPDAPVQPIVYDDPPSLEMDLTTHEDVPAVETPPAAPPEPPELAEPGVYVCVAENVGEHRQLGVLTFGTEYDYTQASAETLEAVAACVAGGYLEQVS